MPGTALVTFDGYKVKLFNQSGQMVGQWDAISGEAGHQKPSEVTLENVGPIPEGNYSFDPAKIQIGDTINIFLNAPLFRSGTWPGGGWSWGTERVFLDGGPANSTRGGFSIHGGVRPGSRGCIDLGPNEEAFFRLCESSAQQGWM